MANCYTALDLGVEVLPVLNKSRPATGRPRQRQGRDRGCHRHRCHVDAIPCSAKTGMGIDEILELIVAKVPAPQGNPDALHCVR